MQFDTSELEDEVIYVSKSVGESEDFQQSLGNNVDGKTNMTAADRSGFGFGSGLVGLGLVRSSIQSPPVRPIQFLVSGP